MNEKILFIGILLASCVVLIVLSARNPVPFSAIRVSGQSFAQYLYCASSTTRDSITNFTSSLSVNRDLYKENNRLRQELEIEQLTASLYQQQLRDANRLLATRLEFPESNLYTVISTRILAYSPQDFFKVLYINKGYEQDVRTGMAVVNTQGLVGKTVEVYPRSSKVMLITDERTKMGIRIERTQDLGVLRGTGSPRVCELDYVLTNNEVREGDTILTSGLGGALPAGIQVGSVLVVDSRPNYVFQQIRVRPAVDFGRVDELFILKVRQ